MATQQWSILGDETPDPGVPLDLISNQITAAGAPSIGRNLAYVMADGGADEGFSGSFDVPPTYVGSPVLIIKGVLDGTPGAAQTLQFGFRKRANANNEAADGTFDAEQTSQVSGRADDLVGSNGAGYADEDLAVFEIALTAGDYAAGDCVEYYFYVDSSGTDYAGNFLPRSILFQYSDA
jgi:hypothetical protein